MIQTNARPAVPGARDAAALLYLLVGYGGALGAVLFLRALSPARLPLVYAVPLALTAGLAFARRLFRAGTTPVARGAGLIGAAFIVFGAGFDITATLIHSPDLSDEQNPIARFLFATGHSTTFVLLYAGLCQGLLVALECLMWFALLAHRESIIESIAAASPTFGEFRKALVGTAHLTWRQRYLPCRPSDLPIMYYPLWIIMNEIVADGS